MKFYTKFKHFRWRKYVWKYLLQYVGRMSVPFLNITIGVWTNSTTHTRQHFKSNFSMKTLIFSFTERKCHSLDLKCSFYTDSWQNHNFLVRPLKKISSKWHSLKQKCCHFDDIFITGCTSSCQWQLLVQSVMKISSKWWHFRFSVSVSVYYYRNH